MNRDVPVLVALLPRPLADLELPESAHEALGTPGTVVVEPARVSYERITGFPGRLAMRLTRGQARRMKLPGTPRVIAILDALQYPLAHALLARHEGAELWYLPLGDATESPLHERAAARAVVIDAEELLPRMRAAGIGTAR